MFASVPYPQNVARRIAQTSIECKVPLDEDEYVEKFAPTLMDVVHTWAGGAPFIDVCHLTDIFEGSIIRNMKRLDELVQQLGRAATAAGDSDLAATFQMCLGLLRRDIMQAASLYV